MSSTYSLQRLYELYQKSTGVSTDTRTLKEGNLFFALRGPSFNGNKFAATALEKGALMAVVDDAQLKGDDFFVVEDTLKALQALAVHHRANLEIPVLGLTGSNGKTTTKELLNNFKDVEAFIANYFDGLYDKRFAMDSADY